MEVLLSLALGVVQGLTEFLPVSSSGHLRLIQDSLQLGGYGLEAAGFGLAFDTLLHVATLLAVVAYFRTDIVHMARAAFSRDQERAADRRLAWLVVAATVPTGVIGLLGGGFFENAPLMAVGAAFLVTSATLWATDRFSRHQLHRAEALRPLPALLVGVAQGVAIMPGVSRSGATMAAGMAFGLDRSQAARFSFLLSGPIILLAAVKQSLDVLGGDAVLPSAAAVGAGFVAAALTGYLAIAGLMRLLREGTFIGFSIYTGLLGIAVIVWQLAA